MSLRALCGVLSRVRARESRASCRPCPSPLSSAPPCRAFSKRLGSGGFVGGGERKVAASKRKQSGPVGGAAGADSGASQAAGGAAGGQQRGPSAGGGGGGGAGGGSSDSISALEAENEERLSPFMLPIITHTAHTAASEGVDEQAVAAEWRYEQSVQRRLRDRFIRDNVRLSGKLRRRWEALNGLTDELRRVCLLEDRTPLPASLPIPRQANGQPLLPTTPGLAGAEPWTERELKQHLNWQQQQKERGLPY